MKIIVISKTDYKEKDVIINAISEEGSISFKVRGGQIPGSAFYWVNNPLSIADVEYVENVRYVHQILKSANLIYSPLHSDLKLNKLLTINLVVEIMNKMLQEEERYLLFHDIEDYFKATELEKNYHLAELIFIAKAIKVAGSEPEVNKCVYCGTKEKIVAFSFAEGGFICKKCLQEDMAIDLTPVQMQIVRFLFNVKNFAYLPVEKMNVKDLKAVFINFRNYISDAIGINLETIDLIANEIE